MLEHTCQINPRDSDLLTSACGHGQAYAGTPQPYDEVRLMRWREVEVEGEGGGGGKGRKERGREVEGEGEEREGESEKVKIGDKRIN